VQAALNQTVDGFEQDPFWGELITTTEWAESQLGGDDESVSTRLHQLAGHLDEFPLDLRDLCGGASVRADEAWPFAMAMFARAPHLIENTLLSAINVGGDADTTGSMLGALLGALHGWAAFPDEWRDGLEAHEDLEAQAESFAQKLLGNVSE